MGPAEIASPYELVDLGSRAKRTGRRIAIFGAVSMILGGALGLSLFLVLQEGGATASPPSVCVAYCLSHGGELNSPSASHGGAGLGSGSVAAAGGGGSLRVNMLQGHHRGQLPLTGAEIVAIVIVALLLVTVGLLVLRRSRRLTDPDAYR